MVIEIIHNVTILLTLMMTPWTFQPGIVFDTRTILLSVSGLIIGIIPTIIAMAIASLYRIYIAGNGIIMGVATIISAGTIGILWAYIRPRWRGKKRYYIEIYVMGLATHIGMLMCIIFLPEEIRLETLKNIAPTVLIVYPIGTLLLGIIFTSNTSRLENEHKFKEEVERRTSFFNASRDMMFVKDDMFRYVLINDAICKFFGKSRKEIIGKSDVDLLPGLLLDMLWYNQHIRMQREKLNGMYSQIMNFLV